MTHPNDVRGWPIAEIKTSPRGRPVLAVSRQNWVPVWLSKLPFLHYQTSCRLTAAIWANSEDTNHQALPNFASRFRQHVSLIWGDGSHDHALRDDEDYRIKIQTLIDNPVRAGLVKHARQYPFVIRPGWWE